MYPKLSACVLLILASSFIFSTCRHKSDCKTPIPDNVSFSRDIIPLFNANCNTSGCHSGAAPTGNLNLEPSKAYSQLMKPGSGYIDTVNVNSSGLYIQMTSASQIMPPTGKLDDCQTGLILKWIQQKAKNN